MKSWKEIFRHVDLLPVMGSPAERGGMLYLDLRGCNLRLLGTAGLHARRFRDGLVLCIVASDRAGWDHVSVSLPARSPTWEEMDRVRGLFFREDEVVLQFHARRDEHVNHHPFCLHLWRPQGEAVPTPPTWMVGPKQGERLDQLYAAAKAAGGAQ